MDVVVNVPANDTDVDGTVDVTSVVITINPTNGTIISINPITGEVTYTPNRDFNGSDSFTYTIKDNTGFNFERSHSKYYYYFGE